MNYRSIVISSLYFMVTLFALTISYGFLQGYSQWIAFILTLIVWFSPGYLAAAIARRHVVLHASLAGVLCCFSAICATYFFEIEGFNFKLGYSWLFVSVVSFGFGALIWSLKSWALSASE